VAIPHSPSWTNAEKAHDESHAFNANRYLSWDDEMGKQKERKNLQAELSLQNAYPQFCKNILQARILIAIKLKNGSSSLTEAVLNFITMTVRYSSAPATSTVTPGPIVELNAIFFIYAPLDPDGFAF
jgi:hypothetical protein